MDPATAFAFISENWAYFMVGLYVAEKIVKVTPTKYDDIIFDMIVSPFFSKVKELTGKGVTAKMIMPILAMLASYSNLEAATITQTHSQGGKFDVLTVAVTCDADGSISKTRLNLPDMIWIIYCETDPGTPAPTDDYDLYIYNGMSVDIMGGGIGNRDTANSERAQPVIDSSSTMLIPAMGPFFLDQSNQAVNAAKYTLRIYYMR